MWAHYENFIQVIKNKWDCVVDESLMYRLVTKLKILRKLNKKEFWCILERVKRTRKLLESTQD